MTNASANDSSLSFGVRNGLSLTLTAIFLICLTAQVVTGRASWNEELLREGFPPLPWMQYLSSGHFVSATFENWESEFLQMGMYVLLTVWLRQRGSAESRPFGEDEKDIEPGETPWPVRKGGVWKALYAHSLTTGFMILFAASFYLHLLGSWHHELDELRIAGRPPIGLMEHLSGATFWFESFQNWQSEFLAVLSIVVLSIFLRQDKSPESKPLRAPHSQTGA
jgi:hypothetical protein